MRVCACVCMWNFLNINTKNNKKVNMKTWGKLQARWFLRIKDCIYYVSVKYFCCIDLLVISTICSFPCPPFIVITHNSYITNNSKWININICSINNILRRVRDGHFFIIKFIHRLLFMRYYVVFYTLLVYNQLLIHHILI